MDVRPKIATGSGSIAPDDAPVRQGGPSRRTRALIVGGEAVVAAVGGGLVVGGVLGITLAVLAVLVVPVVLLVRWRWLSAEDPAATATDFVSSLRVLGVESRSSSDVGVIGDGQGFAAGMAVDLAKGAVLDIETLCEVVAADPSRPSSLQIRLTTYAPPSPGSGVFRRQRGESVATHRRLHVLLRLEPAWAGDVVAAHGGGAQGSRAALVAAVDRLAARLRRAGVSNRVMDTGALNALLAEDTAPDLPTRLFAADPGSQGDVDRLLSLVRTSAPERSVVSLCVDLASSDQWQTYAAVLIAAQDSDQRSAVTRALLDDPAVLGLASGRALPAVLPLGGGPGDLTSVLTLARV